MEGLQDVWDSFPAVQHPKENLSTYLSICLLDWLIGKDPDAGIDWRQKEKGTTEDEMVGWHHWLVGHKSEQALGVGDGQGSLVCCSPWGRKESDTTEQLNWSVYLCWIKMKVNYETLHINWPFGMENGHLF